MEPFITEVNDWNREIGLFIGKEERSVSGTIVNKKAPYISYSFIAEVNERFNVIKFIDYVSSSYEIVGVNKILKTGIEFYDEICELIQDIIKQDRIRLLLGAVEI